jgi:ABC-type multidrug transport system fused ATPase/permease subunit
MAETVASFGSIPTEERRYARALRGVSNSAIKVRRSFSVLKLIQALILGLGSSAIVFSAWMSSSSRLFESTGGSSLHRHQDSIAGTLVLAQALFAQLCAPLDHVGQHFRDCVSAAEDLRELEELKRSTGVANIKANAPTDLTRYPATVNAIAERIRNASWSLPVSAAQNESLKYCLEIKNLSFSYPSSARGAVADGTAPKRLLLRNVSLSIPCGGYAVGLCGPSGTIY